VGKHVLYYDGSIKGLSMSIALAETASCKLQATVKCQTICTIYDVTEITNDEPLKNSGVIKRAAKCRCQIAKVPLQS
jgi:hypothetical protein